MAKLVLGRNLEMLLDGSAKESANGDSAGPETAPVGSGVRSLMRGHPATPANSVEPAPAQKVGLPGWYLYGADILLAALALVVAFKSPHPLTWPKELFCTVAVVLGGCLAMGAVWMEDGPDDQ